MTKRIISCLLILIFCLAGFVACGDKEDDAPEGMYSVTRPGEPFILYVQGDWTDNRDSGISSAYYSIYSGVVVSARYYALPDGGTLDSYIDVCAEEYAASYSGFKVVDRSVSALGGEKAVRYEYNFDKISGEQTENVTVIQYYTIYKGDVILLSFYCSSAKYNEEYAAVFEEIRREFVLTDKKQVNDEIVDKKTPEGMKIASPDGIEYVFYVPKTWVTDRSDKLSDAYFPESERSNVTVTAFAPNGEMTTEQYFDVCENTYKNEISGYQRLSAEDKTVDGKAAKSYTYKAVYGDTTFRIMQTVVYYNSMFYSITYTAVDEIFDKHISDVEKMINDFDFR